MAGGVQRHNRWADHPATVRRFLESRGLGELATACVPTAALAAGVTGDLRPYRLRGSFVSLLLWSGEDLVYVADQAGHSVATLARHYAGVIRELRDVPKAPAAELIEAARKEVTATNGTHTLRGE